MQVEHWPTIETLFEDLLALPAEERSGSLAAADADDAVKSEVAALVAAYERCELFLEKPALGGGLSTKRRRPAMDNA